MKLAGDPKLLKPQPYFVCKHFPQVHKCVIKRKLFFSHNFFIVTEKIKNIWTKTTKKIVLNRPNAFGNYEINEGTKNS